MIGASRAKAVVASAPTNGKTAAQIAKSKARKLKGKRKGGRCACCSLSELRKNIPTFPELVFRMRYCKFSFVCKVSWISALVVVALILYLLGGLLPGVLGSAFGRRILATFIHRDIDQWVAPPMIARVFGGSESIEQDDGEEVQITLSHVVNAQEALTYGSRPRMQTKGPYIFRQYTQRYNGSIESDAVRFVERKFHKTVEGDLNQVITIANPAFRHVEALLASNPETASQSFEQGSVALLGSWGLRELRQSFGPTIKQAAFPALVGGVFDRILTSIYSGSRTGLLAYWRTSGRLGVPLNGHQHSLRLPPPRDGNTTVPISDLVARAMWTWTDTFALTSPQGWHWYLLSVSSQRVREWAAHYGVIENRYLADAQLAQRHALQIADWIQLLLANTLEHRDGSEGQDGIIAAIDPQVPEALEFAIDFENRAAELLHNNSILPRANWSLVIGAQLGSNSVMGYQYKVLSDYVGGGLSELSHAAGLLLSNQCPQSASSLLSGSSLIDFDMARESYVIPAIAEVSCWGARVLPVPGRSTSRTYYSKLGPEVMTNLIRLFSTGPSIGQFMVPGSRTLQLMVSGIDRLEQSVNVRNSILDIANAPSSGLFSWVSRLKVAQLELAAAAPGSVEQHAAEAEIRAVSTGHSIHLRSNDVALVNAVCNAGFMPPVLRSYGLSCYQQIDFVNFMRYFAREFAWKPSFVWRAPDGRIDPQNLRAGPFITASVSEILYGLQDQFYFQMFGSPFPGLGLEQFDDEDAWSSLTAPVATPLQVRTGTSSGEGGGMELSRHMYTWDGEMETQIWTTSTPVEGSYDYKMFPAHLDRHFQRDGGPGPEGQRQVLIIWNPYILRSERFGFLGEDTSSSNGLLRAWRFERLGAADASPFLRSDVLMDAPFCLRSLAALPGPLAGTRLGMDYMYGPPYMHGCDLEQTKVFQYGGAPSTSNLTHGSFIDVEPTTGRVLRAVQRHSLFLRWQASEWYPNMRPTVGSLAYVQREKALHPIHQRGIANMIESVNYTADVAIPTSMFILASIAVLVAAVLGWYMRFPCVLPGQDRKMGKKKRSRRRVQPVPFSSESKVEPSTGVAETSGTKALDSNSVVDGQRSVSFAPTDTQADGGARGSNQGGEELHRSDSSYAQMSRSLSRSESMREDSQSFGQVQTAMGSKIGRHLGRGAKSDGRSLAEGRRALQQAKQYSAEHTNEYGLSTDALARIGSRMSIASDSKADNGSASSTVRDGLRGDLPLARPTSSKKERADQRRTARQAGKEGNRLGTLLRAESGPASSKRGKFGGSRQVV